MSGMSDFEINKMIAEILLTDSKPHITKALGHSSAAFIGFADASITMRFDPCNSPADAWDIIIDNGIELTLHRINGVKTGDYEAGGMFYKGEEIDFNEVVVVDENPLRAAMLCFLEMRNKSDA
jgi:hypothetical protein